jgi:hypothetical protein
MLLINFSLLYIIVGLINNCNQCNIENIKVTFLSGPYKNASSDRYDIEQIYSHYNKDELSTFVNNLQTKFSCVI